MDKFNHFLSGVSAPVELTEILPADQEFAHLTKYLGLSPSPRLLLDSPFTLVLVRRWMSHPDLRYVKSLGTLLLPSMEDLMGGIHDYNPIYIFQVGSGLQLHCSSPPADTSSTGIFFSFSCVKLVVIPFTWQDYSNLINSISSFTCPRSIGEESKIPRQA